MSYKYKLSVIIPIYNVEKYLEETILSVINQSIGFEKNIQLILINDGSLDNSEDVCLKYKQMYPKNIIYVKQENTGVSSARNHGIDYIEGKYVNFLDSDDKWKIDAFLKIYNFFEIHYDEVDLVAARIKFFEERKNYHILDYKFNGDKIVNLLEEYDQVQLSIASVFFKSKIVRKYRFDKNLKYAEDAKYVNDILLRKPKYGIMQSAIYYYRKRFDGSSAMQNLEQDISWYILTINSFHYYILELSKSIYNCVIPYIQFLIMYELQWRFKTTKTPPLSDKDIGIYYDKLCNLLTGIEDSIILEQKFISIEHKIYILSKKYNKNIAEDLMISQYKKKNKLLDAAFYNDCFLFYIKDLSFVKIHILEVQRESMRIEGQINTVFNNIDFNVFYQIDENAKVKLNLTDNHLGDIVACGKWIKQNKSFAIKIPVKEMNKLKFMLQYKDYKECQLNINYTKTSKLSNKTKIYYQTNEYLFYNKNMELIKIKNNFKNHLFLEIRLMEQLLYKKQLKVLLYRITYHIAKLCKRKEIWLISDRPNTANDNGYHLFKYICNQKNNNIKPYFVISKKYRDYKKVNEIGKVLNYDSLKYKVIFLLADKVISSQADDWVVNAFGKKNDYYRDLYKYKFIFLQHGIIKDDLSGWLHKFNKNIAMFVTSAEKEYKSILDGKYGYDEKVVKLTGMPRYDALKDEKKKQIVVMPTWRKSCAGSTVKGIRTYNASFKYSEYFKFYNTLINDTKLLSAIMEKEYQGIFVNHPSLVVQYDDFEFNNVFRKDSKFFDYQTLFKESSLLITDYSSVAMDFAYLYKPVIYTQFDKKEFFKQHIYVEGYFDYERDGFGPVVYDYKSTVDEIVKSIENDCIIEDKYIERINQFYKYHDKDNCKRVYDEILKLDI